MYLKKKNGNSGSLLLESLVSLSILSTALLVLVPTFNQSFSLIEQKQIEGEGWRYFQDSAALEKVGTHVQTQVSDGKLLEWTSSGNHYYVTVSDARGMEVLHVEMYP